MKKFKEYNPPKASQIKRERYFRISVWYELNTSSEKKNISFIVKESSYPLDEDIVNFMRQKIPGSEKFNIMVAEMSKADYAKYKKSKEPKQDNPKIITK